MWSDRHITRVGLQEKCSLGLEAQQLASALLALPLLVLVHLLSKQQIFVVESKLFCQKFSKDLMIKGAKFSYYSSVTSQPA
jgi:hypothetical protein